MILVIAHVYSSLFIADYLLAKGESNLTPLHVNKMSYISHGFTLAVHDAPLVYDDVEAWQYGPVFPSLYYALRQYGGVPIPRLSYCNTALGSIESGERLEFFNKILGKKTEVIDMVLDTYGKLSGSDLISLTHAKGTPWKKYYKKNKHGIKIPREEIKWHYKEIINGRF